MEYHMPYGKVIIPITLPDSIRQTELTVPNQKTIKNSEELLISTLENPIGTKPLREIIENNLLSSIVIVVDDQTRKFPHNLILAPLLRYLHNLGINENVITILIATGVHRHPTQSELEYLFGTRIMENYSIIWNDQTIGDFTDLGITSHGTPVLINSMYLNADLKILLTDVTLHYFAGFGGDRKSIFPGIAASPSINKNHAQVMQGIYPGNIESNPIHEDMMEAAHMAGADFVVNVSLNSEGDILDIHSGALELAFLEAVKTYKSTCVVPVKEKADLLILSSGGHPFDSNYQQSMKAVMQCQNAVKPGGKVLYFLKGDTGIGIRAFKGYLEQFSSSQSVMEYTKSHEYKQGMHNTYYYRKFTEEHDVYYKTDLPMNYVQETLGVNFVEDLNSTFVKLLNDVKLVYIIRHGTKIMVKFDP